MWPFQEKQPELTQRELMESEKKQHLINAALDPRPTLDEQEKSFRKDQYAQILKWQQNREFTNRNLLMGFAALRAKQTNDGLIIYEEDPFNKKVCSIQAAKKLIEFIKPLDHNVMLANWDETKINKEMFAIATSLMDFSMYNSEDFEIDIKDYEYIIDTMVTAQHPSYQRGLNDGERRVMKETIKVNEVSTGQPQKPIQKVFGLPISQ